MLFPALRNGESGFRLLHAEQCFFALALVLLNWPLVTGVWRADLTFLPACVSEGEWWRLLTHPFVHVSWYHLLLDVSAFFILYSGLQERSGFRRLGYVAASAMGSLLISLWAEPMIYSIGLCGLSGVAHGLMAISALEMMRANDRSSFRIGVALLAVVIIKSALEAAMGQVVFSFLHFGRLGIPIAVCHAGGAVGGLLAWLIFGRLAKR